MAHYVLILAAGIGSRLNNKTPKQFLELRGVPIVFHSPRKFHEIDSSAKIYIGLPKVGGANWTQLCSKYNFTIDHSIYSGGQTRLETVFLGLKKIHQEHRIAQHDIISIHDAARPFIQTNLIQELTNTAKKTGGAIPVIKLKDSLRIKKRNCAKDHISKNRDNYIITQTPQVFHLDKIFKNYTRLFNDNIDASLMGLFDDASVYGLFHNYPPLSMIEGEESNIKITTQLDYILSEKIYQFLKREK